jgi:hypothetical protein
MVRAQSASGEAEILEAASVERDKFKYVSASESEESSSGETTFFDEEFLQRIDNDEYSNGDLNSPTILLCDLGKISNVYRNPNNKVANFYPGPPSGLIRREIDDYEGGDSYLIVLARCWQIDPDYIHKEDIKYIKLDATETAQASEALTMLALYTLKCNISSNLYHSAFELLPLLKTEAQKRLLVIISSNYSKHNGEDGQVQKHQQELIELLKRVPFDEASIQVAIVINYELGEFRINGLLEKDFQLYFPAVLDYYQKFKPEEVSNLMSKWIAFFMEHPEEEPRILSKIPKSFEDVIKKDVEWQKQFLQFLICKPKKFERWTKLLNWDLFDKDCKRLCALFDGDQNVENPTTEEAIILNDQELKTIRDPFIEYIDPIYHHYNVKYKGKKEGFRFSKQTSYGSAIRYVTRMENAGIPLYVEWNGEACASESLICQHFRDFEIKEGYPPDNQFPLFPVSPELEQRLKEHTTIVKRLDYGWKAHLLRLPATFGEMDLPTFVKEDHNILGKWNYVIVNFPLLFSLKTRFLWFKSLLGPERYKGKKLTRKLYTIKRKSLLEQGVRILRSDIASYWVRFKFEFDGEPKAAITSTNEFYSEYSKELINRLVNESSDAYGWKDLGYLIARCILDEHFIDLHPVLYLFKEPSTDSLLDGEEREQFIEETKNRKNLVDEGIKEFFRSNPFSIFRRDEIPMLLGNNLDKPVLWVPSGGYHDFSTQFLWLIKIFNDFDHEMQSAFFQFVSASRVLGPNTRITVVPLEGDDNVLPMASVGSNCLKLPQYTSEEVLAKKLIHAITKGI